MSNFSQLKDEILNKPFSTNKKTCPTAPPKEAFNPAKTFYDSSSGKYITDVGKHYREYSRKKAIMQGIKRHMELHNMDDDIESLMEEIELDRAIDWQGSIAGYMRGIHLFHNKSYLVKDEPNTIAKAEGAFPLIKDIIDQAFPSEDSKNVFLSWLRDGVRAVNASHHHPAPMLVMAGERSAGKSLIALITTKALGGRASNPMKAWSGKTLWNNDLLGAELLLIDDSEASTDIRARKALGANFKESIYGENIKIQTRNTTAMDMRPVWRVVICCNETPENLSVIPPLEEGIEDKIILLKVKMIKTPMPAQSVEEKAKFVQAIEAELPAQVHYLESMETPSHLQDNRDGVIAWKDPSLLQAINEISPEHRLEALITLCIDQGFMEILQGESSEMSAAEIQQRLTDRDSPTAEQARGLLKHDNNCGTYLTRLVKKGSAIITERIEGKGGKPTRYRIKKI